MKNQGIYNSQDAGNGVFIFTESGNYVTPKFWGIHEDSENPVGVAIIRERKLLVALNGSDGSLELLDYNKELTGKKLESLDDALLDEKGIESTSELASMGSEVATFCKEYESGQISKGNWYLPTVRDMQLMYDNKKELDIALAICGGEAIETDDWHWTSTRRSDRTHWIFYWNDGDRSDFNQYGIYRVRPVSAFLSSL